MFTEFQRAKIVGIASTASIHELEALLPVPIIVEPGQKTMTNSNFQGQEADLKVIPCKGVRGKQQDKSSDLVPGRDWKVWPRSSPHKFLHSLGRDFPLAVIGTWGQPRKEAGP